MNALRLIDLPSFLLNVHPSGIEALVTKIRLQGKLIHPFNWELLRKARSMVGALLVGTINATI
jgi:hypothetical protein